MSTITTKKNYYCRGPSYFLSIYCEHNAIQSIKEQSKYKNKSLLIQQWKKSLINQPTSEQLLKYSDYYICENCHI